MSVTAIRAALETHLNGMAPSLATAWQNVTFQPPAATTPFQVVHLMLADPDNREAGEHYQERGYFQVTLQYPVQTGPGAAEARALALQTRFKKGTSLTNAGITVVVDATPAIGNGRVDVDRWAVPVKIPFHADIN